jgi:predicted small lipoprotein YifL
MMKKKLGLPILVGLIVIVLSGCGQTGALYLPKDKKEKQVTTPTSADNTVKDTSK